MKRYSTGPLAVAVAVHVMVDVGSTGNPAVFDEKPVILAGRTVTAKRSVPLQSWYIAVELEARTQTCTALVPRGGYHVNLLLALYSCPTDQVPVDDEYVTKRNCSG